MEFGILGALAVLAVRALTLLHGYLGTNSFPQPLDPEEEARCLKRMREEGDEEARNILIEHNLRLVAHIVKKFDTSSEDVEDLISVGTIGLIKGVETFDPGKSTRLATYAARCIENEILMYLRSVKKIRNEVSLQEPIGSDREGNEITLMDVLQDEGDPVPDVVGQRFQARRLLNILCRLGRRERWVLALRFGLFQQERRTQREVAQILGISRSYVSRIEKKAVRKLSRDISADGI